MSAVIYTNQASLMAQKGLLGAQSSLANSVERLSSGLRINRAKDDAAGLGVGENLQKQLNGAKQGLMNLNDAISMSQTAEGALSAVAAVAQRMITLATQGANDTMSQDQRKSIAYEIDKLRTSIQDMGKRTKYTDTVLFASKEMYIQASNNAADRITVDKDALAGISVDTNFVKAFDGGSPIELPAVTITNGIFTIPINTDMVAGQYVIGKGIPPGTKIDSIVVSGQNEQTVKLSNTTISTAQAKTVDLSLKISPVKLSAVTITAGVFTIPSNTDVVVGQDVIGDNIPLGTKIESIVVSGQNEQTVTLSNLTISTAQATTVDLTLTTSTAELSAVAITNGVFKVPTNSNMVVGQYVNGAGIPAGTRIQSIVDSGQNEQTVTLSDLTFSTDPAETVDLTLKTNPKGTDQLKLGNVDDLVAGQTIWGTGIPEGTTVLEVDKINKRVILSSVLTDDAGGSYTANIGGAHTSTSGADLSTKISSLMNAIGTPTGLTSDLFRDIQAKTATYLNDITYQRGQLGAVQNQLEFTISNLTEFSNNLAASRSRVMDTDYAAETANLTKGQILQQASTAMLAQANQMPNVILSLLK